MLDVTSPVIQVVTTGTDWPAIAAVISTGIVGLAGIGGTIWQATRNWYKEEQRAKVAQKRRIYAGFLTSCYELLLANSRAKSRRKAASSPTGFDAAEQFEMALTNAVSARSELELIAPPQVRDLADTFLSSIIDDEIRSPEPRARVVAAMRADLGEPPLKSEVETPAPATLPPKT
jgi:hypothetical protein